MQQKNNTNPVALITGSAKRIGREIAQYLHSQNFDVIVHYNTSKAEANELVGELNNKRPDSAILIQANLSHIKDINFLAEQALNFKDKINLLINNASFFQPNSIYDTNTTEWDNLFESTVKGCYFLTQNLIEPLKRNSGNVVNILDTHYQKPRKGFSLYSMAKSALAMQTQSFALELAPYIRVNGIALGHFMRAEYKAYHKNEEQIVVNNIPLQRAGNISDINITLDYIIRNTYLTGEIIHLDGGKLQY